MHNLLSKVTMANLKYQGQLLRELVYTRTCRQCSAQIEGGLLCASCRKHYLLQRQNAWQPREEYLAGMAEARPQDVLRSMTWLYKYDGIYKHTLYDLKFEMKLDALAMLQEEALRALPGCSEDNCTPEAVRKRWLHQFDVITNVPTSAERLAARGYDVPRSIFQPIFSVLGLWQDDVLSRVRRTASLFELAPEERRTELAGCFAVGSLANVRGKRVLLVDDIFTTGSTLTEAALVLQKAGAKAVHGLTLTTAKENW